MNRKQSGSKGGRATLAKHGYKHFQEIGRKGGQATQARYRLAPYGLTQYAMVSRETGKIAKVIGRFSKRDLEKILS